MEKNYDKIALAVAFLLLLGGLYLALPLFRGELELPDARINPSEISGNAYEDITVVPINREQKEWSPSGFQGLDGESWNYEIFTPPKIHINEKGKIVETPIIEIAPQPFGIQLVAITHPNYRIRFDGHINRKYINLYHLFENKSVKNKQEGDRIEEWGIVIKDLKVETVSTTEKGSIRMERIATLTLYDEKLDRVMIMRPGQQLIREDITNIRMLPVSPTGAIFIWEKAGDTWERKVKHGVAKYTLIKFDFDKQQVTVKKEALDLEEPLELDLSAKGETSTEPSTSPKPEKRPSTDTDPDLSDFFK